MGNEGEDQKQTEHLKQPAGISLNFYFFSLSYSVRSFIHAELVCLIIKHQLMKSLQI